MNPKQTILAIDPGAGGGIALLTNGTVHAVPMPKDVDEMNQYFTYIFNTYENIIVIIEKVSLWGKADDAPGKKFGIQKMLKNYEQLLTVIKMIGFRFIEVPPVTWQTTLGLKMKKDKGMEYSEFKSFRKRVYKEYATKCFPTIKRVTLKTSDALCLLRFGIVKIDNDIDWIRERLQNNNHKTTLM